MEDWQEWQLRADQIASDLSADVDRLEAEFLSPEGADPNLRAFWPRFRDLKERVRTAPAIRLEPKLDLERRLRSIGSRAYKLQEVVFARSADRRRELLEVISGLRAAAESQNFPRQLRGTRRDLDQMRPSFDQGVVLAPADRQAVWDAWRDASQFAWQKLVDGWTSNEEYLREILSAAREHLARGNAAATRQAVGRFFEEMRDREVRQASINEIKGEAEELRREADTLAERAAVAATPARRAPAVPTIDTWRSDLARNRELMSRLQAEVDTLDQEVQASRSVLDQAMVRGTLVGKRRKLDELAHSSRQLEQRIAQAEESPVISGT
jgi:hypothetical protein